MKYVIGITTGFIVGALAMWVALNRLYAIVFDRLYEGSRRPRYVSYNDRYRY